LVFPVNVAGSTRLQRGRLAEQAVCVYLRNCGWSIVAANVHVGRLELDVVARKGSVVAVVEVRTRGRSSWVSGFGSIDSQKRGRIRRAGELLWQRRYRSDPTVDRLRYDAASVRFHEDGSSSIDYAEAAF
jgi:putative endonuclease